jgi:hypothetical protein
MARTLLFFAGGAITFVAIASSKIPAARSDRSSAPSRADEDQDRLSRLALADVDDGRSDTALGAIT